MAQDMVTGKLKSNLTDAEVDMVENSTKNTRLYQKSKSSIENSFFQTILEHANSKLHSLVDKVEDTQPRQLYNKKYFYIVTRGKKMEGKKAIMN